MWCKINSNDPQQPTAEVSLTGRGAYPELVIEAPTLWCSMRLAWSVSERSLLLSNAGSEQLTIHNIQDPNVGIFPLQPTDLQIFT